LLSRIKNLNQVARITPFDGTQSLIFRSLINKTNKSKFPPFYWGLNVYFIFIREGRIRRGETSSSNHPSRCRCRLHWMMIHVSLTCLDHLRFLRAFFVAVQSWDVSASVFPRKIKDLVSLWIMKLFVSDFANYFLPIRF
jgi:hypothetical protein